MFERYTEKARRVVFFARYEACQFGSPYIETQHLLLGLLRESKEVLRLVNLSGEDIRRLVDHLTPPQTPTPTSVDLPLSQESKRALKFAADEADRLAHKHIGTEHLLLGLLDVEDSLAAKLLREGGADVAKIRSRLAEEYRQTGNVFERGFLYNARPPRFPAVDTVEIHGIRRNADYIRDVVSMIRTYTGIGIRRSGDRVTS